MILCGCVSSRNGKPTGVAIIINPIIANIPKILNDIFLQRHNPNNGTLNNFNLVN